MNINCNYPDYNGFKVAVNLSNLDYGQNFERLYNKSCKNITIVVTHDCTLRCSYCYEKHKQDKRMLLETGKRVVDFLFAEDSNNSRIINEEEAYGLIIDFIGGEPLLEIDLIDDIMDYFINKAIRLNHRWQKYFMISMSSNGTEYFSHKVQKFLKKYKGKVSLSITVDGNKYLHDKCRRFVDGKPSYDLCMSAAKDMAENHNQRSTKITLAPENIEYLFDAAINMFNELDCEALHANTIFEEGWKIEHARIFYSELKRLADWMIDNEIYKSKYCSLFEFSTAFKRDVEDDVNWCGGTGKMLAFDVDGIIYPCLRYTPVAMGEELSKTVILGSLDDGLLKTKKQEELFNYLESITMTSQSPQKCIDCPINFGCAWCSAHNYEACGSINKRATYSCDMHKARCLAISYYYNKLAIKENLEVRYPVNTPKDWALEIIPEEEYNKLIEMSKLEK